MNTPKPGEVYRHYKHSLARAKNNYTYKIVSIGWDTHQKNKVIIYKPLYECGFLKEKSATVFSRPMSIFMQTVKISDVDMPRFVKIDVM